MSESDKVFNGGSLVEWIICRNAILLEADRQNCRYQLVCENDDVVDGAVMEAVFTGQRLCVKGQEQEFVDQSIDRQIEGVRQAAGAKRQRIEDLNYGAGIANVLLKSKDLNAVTDKEADDVIKLEQSKLKLILDTQAAGNRYDLELRQFDGDRARAITLLHKHLGPNPRNIIATELAEQRPRAAWRKLLAVYANDASSAAHLNTTFNLMSNMQFDKKFGDVEEHMGMLDRLNETLEAAGRGQTNGELLGHLIRAIERSADGIMYKTVLDVWSSLGKIKDEDRDPLLSALRTVEQKAKSAEALKGKRTIAGAKFSQADVAFAGAAVEGKKKTTRRRPKSKTEQAAVSVGKSEFTCNKCGKPGHKAKDCPAKVCVFCKKLGHLEEACWKKYPSKRPEKFQANAAESVEKEKDLSKVKNK